MILASDFHFDRTPTVGIIIFELFVVGASLGAFLLLRRIVKRLWLRALVTCIGVMIFEMFTAPAWLNEKLGVWAYVYHDVSWVLTVGWTALILSVVLLVDRYLSHWGERKRFAAYLGILLVPAVAAEMLVVGLGIRSYSPEVWESVSGVKLFHVPLEILYYVPVFMALIIAFYKYWSFVIDDAVLIPVKRQKWLRGIAIAFVGVFLFELMIEPMVSNEKLPAWSYIYNDVSFIMTGMWVLVIAIAGVAINRVFLHLPTWMRFVIALMIMSSLMLPIESWLIINGYRVYGPSAVENFSGHTTPLTGVAVEVAIAIPCYLALIVAFIRHWEIVLDNRL